MEQLQVLVPEIKIPIAGIAGDQQAALFGQMCTQPGNGKKYIWHRMFYVDEYRCKSNCSKNNLLRRSHGKSMAKLNMHWKEVYLLPAQLCNG